MRYAKSAIFTGAEYRDFGHFGAIFHTCMF